MISYSYYGLHGWIDVEYEEPEDYQTEKEIDDYLNKIRLTYYPPYYADENVSIYIDVNEFDKPDPVDYWLNWYEYEED